MDDSNGRNFSNEFLVNEKIIVNLMKIESLYLIDKKTRKMNNSKYVFKNMTRDVFLHELLTYFNPVEFCNIMLINKTIYNTASQFNIYKKIKQKCEYGYSKNYLDLARISCKIGNKIWMDYYLILGNNSFDLVTMFLGHSNDIGFFKNCLKKVNNIESVITHSLNRSIKYKNNDLTIYILNNYKVRYRSIFKWFYYLAVHNNKKIIGMLHYYNIKNKMIPIEHEISQLIEGVCVGGHLNSFKDLILENPNYEINYKLFECVCISGNIKMIKYMEEIFKYDICVEFMYDKLIIYEIKPIGLAVYLYTINYIINNSEKLDHLRLLNILYKIEYYDEIMQIIKDLHNLVVIDVDNENLIYYYVRSNNLHEIEQIEIKFDIYDLLRISVELEYVNLVKHFLEKYPIDDEKIDDIFNSDAICWYTLPNYEIISLLIIYDVQNRKSNIEEICNIELREKLLKNFCHLF
jgi:hypothetical protein